MTIPEIVTVEQALAHLNLNEVPSEADLRLKIAAATQLVCEHVADRQPADADWIAEIESWSVGSPDPTAPKLIVLAILLQVGEFMRFRGDDLATDRPPSGDGSEISIHVKRLLHRYRSPSLA